MDKILSRFDAWKGMLLSYADRFMFVEFDDHFFFFVLFYDISMAAEFIS